ncbi:hypothetical protein ABZT02_36760 [Streptomyces sp. NPDC005402]|uniref:hypothetical protein n=1 Tax=Streptomyces sp. NPDC005402 TaxID=3155338 RepID=UPI0033AC41E5
MGNKNALTDGAFAATATKVRRLVHASARELQKRSGQCDHGTWAEPVSQKCSVTAAYLFSTQVVRSMRVLGIRVEQEEADKYRVLYYLGAPASGP